VLTNSEGERVRYWIVSDNPRFSMGGTPPVGVQWSSLQEGFNKVPGASGAVMISNVRVNASSVPMYGVESMATT
jgi:hypothetical protein